MTENNSKDNQAGVFTNLKPGTKVANYKIIKLLDSDKTGTVYIANDTQLDKKVILQLTPSKQTIEQAKSAARLSHPNIISIHETGEYKNQYYLVMDYVDGKPLNEFIEESSVSIDFAIDVGIQICDALAYSHSENVICGNINSSDIIIDADGHPRLSGFGVYDGKKDIHSDLLSLGVVLYEMLIGKKSPCDIYDEATIKTGLARQPEKLVVIIEKLLNKKTDGYKTADELLADLMSLPESKKITGPKPVDWWNRYIVPVAFAIILIMAIYWLFYDK